MSTLALRPVGAPAPAPASNPLSSLVGRLIRAREAQAKRQIHRHLIAMGDIRLQALGFSSDDIAALGRGEPRLPQGRSGL